MTFWRFYGSRLLAALWASLSLTALVALTFALMTRMGDSFLSVMGFYALFTFLYSSPVALVLAPPIALLARRLPTWARAAVYALVAALIVALLFRSFGPYAVFAAIGGLLFAFFEGRADKPQRTRAVRDLAPAGPADS